MQAKLTQLAQAISEWKTNSDLRESLGRNDFLSKKLSEVAISLFSEEIAKDSKKQIKYLELFQNGIILKYDICLFDFQQAAFVMWGGIRDSFEKQSLLNLEHMCALVQFMNSLLKNNSSTFSLIDNSFEKILRDYFTILTSNNIIEKLPKKLSVETLRCLTKYKMIVIESFPKIFGLLLSILEEEITQNAKKGVYNKKFEVELSVIDLIHQLFTEEQKKDIFVLSDTFVIRCVEIISKFIFIFQQYCDEFSKREQNKKKVSLSTSNVLNSTQNPNNNISSSQIQIQQQTQNPVLSSNVVSEEENLVFKIQKQEISAILTCLEIFHAVTLLNNGVLPCESLVTFLSTICYVVLISKEIESIACTIVEILMKNNLQNDRAVQIFLEILEYSTQHELFHGAIFFIGKSVLRTVNERKNFNNNADFQKSFEFPSLLIVLELFAKVCKEFREMSGVKVEILSITKSFVENHEQLEFSSLEWEYIFKIMKQYKSILFISTQTNNQPNNPTIPINTQSINKNENETENYERIRNLICGILGEVTNLLKKLTRNAKMQNAGILNQQKNLENEGLPVWFSSFLNIAKAFNWLISEDFNLFVLGYLERSCQPQNRKWKKKLRSLIFHFYHQETRTKIRKRVLEICQNLIFNFESICGEVVLDMLVNFESQYAEKTSFILNSTMYEINQMSEPSQIPLTASTLQFASSSLNTSPTAPKMITIDFELIDFLKTVAEHFLEQGERSAGIIEKITNVLLNSILVNRQANTSVRDHSVSCLLLLFKKSFEKVSCRTFTFNIFHYFMKALTPGEDPIVKQRILATLSTLKANTKGYLSIDNQVSRYLRCVDSPLFTSLSFSLPIGVYLESLLNLLKMEMNWNVFQSVCRCLKTMLVNGFILKFLHVKEQERMFQHITDHFENRRHWIFEKLKENSEEGDDFFYCVSELFSVLVTYASLFPVFPFFDFLNCVLSFYKPFLKRIKKKKMNFERMTIHTKHIIHTLNMFIFQISKKDIHILFGNKKFKYFVCEFIGITKEFQKDSSRDDLEKKKENGEIKAQRDLYLLFIQFLHNLVIRFAVILKVTASVSLEVAFFFTRKMIHTIFSVGVEFMNEQKYSDLMPEVPLFSHQLIISLFSSLSFEMRRELIEKFLPQLYTFSGLHANKNPNHKESSQENYEVNLCEITIDYLFKLCYLSCENTFQMNVQAKKIFGSNNTERPYKAWCVGNCIVTATSGDFNYVLLQFRRPTGTIGYTMKLVNNILQLPSQELAALRKRSGVMKVPFFLLSEKNEQIILSQIEKREQIKRANQRKNADTQSKKKPSKLKNLIEIIKKTTNDMKIIPPIGGINTNASSSASSSSSNSNSTTSSNMNNFNEEMDGKIDPPNEMESPQTANVVNHSGNSPRTEKCHIIQPHEHVSSLIENANSKVRKLLEAKQNNVTSDTQNRSNESSTESHPSQQNRLERGDDISDTKDSEIKDPNNKSGTNEKRSIDDIIDEISKADNISKLFNSESDNNDQKPLSLDSLNEQSADCVNQIAKNKDTPFQFVLGENNEAEGSSTNEEKRFFDADKGDYEDIESEENNILMSRSNKIASEMQIKHNSEHSNANFGAKSDQVDDFDDNSSDFSVSDWDSDEETGNQDENDQSDMTSSNSRGIINSSLSSSEKRNSDKRPSNSSQQAAKELEKASTVIHPNFVYLFLRNWPFFTHTSQKIDLQNFNKNHNVVSLKTSNDLRKALEIFDLVPPFEVMYFGLIYVGPGQTKEDDIFSNSCGSAQYFDFINCLGDFVSVRHVLANKDKGLATNDTPLFFVDDFDIEEDGEYALVYRDEIFHQILFHAATLMPTKKNTIENKKRQIGNDYVTIVFSDNSQQLFQMGTISGQFNFVYIVIYPIDAQLSKVQVLVREDVAGQIADFGPFLPDQFHIVNNDHLPEMIRITAIHADLAIREYRIAKGQHVSNWQERSRQIKRMTKRFAVPQAKDINDHISEFFGAGL